MHSLQKCRVLILLLCGGPIVAQALPQGFVYLSAVDPSIQQEMRYAGDHNFIGRPIKGYQQASCILTKPAAEALKSVQKKLLARGYSLKVYDCYRPQMAVNDFANWSQMPQQTTMQAEFYPRTPKAQLFALGYIAYQSGHSRGSTVDLTIVPLPVKAEPRYQSGQKLAACYAPYTIRYLDNSIDMGTGYDCLDSSAHINNKNISQQAYQNRILLRSLMLKNNFEPYNKEWWHFTLKNEPYPNQIFNFLVD